MGGKRRGGLSRNLYRLIPFSTMAGFGGLLATTEAWPLAVPLAVGAAMVGRRLLDRKGNARKELRRRARANVAELGRVAREDRIAASQMKRIAELQEGLLESWELVPEEYGPLLLEDLHTIVDEVEVSARLARRRAALRRHLESADRRAIVERIRNLETELEALEEGSALRASFGAALKGRRGELTAYDGIPKAIGAINAQLEGIESLLGNLRGELLALDPTLSPYALESGLVGIKEPVAYFRRSLDEVTRSVDRLPERLSAR